MPEPLPSHERPAWLRNDLGDATGAGIRVAVIDSGRDPEWDTPQIQPGIGLVTPDDAIRHHLSDDDHDRLGHGTACCDIVLSIAPEVELHPIRVFGSSFETSPESIAVALKIAIDQGYDVVNLSLGTHREDAVRPLYQVCEEAKQQGTLVVAAVQFSLGTSFPAAFDHVLGVQAGRFGNIFEYETRPGKAADYLAQGDRDVRWLKGTRRRIYGSSFAAPHISGIVALLKEKNPEIDLDGARRLLARFAAPPNSNRSHGPSSPAKITAPKNVLPAVPSSQEP